MEDSGGVKDTGLTMEEEGYLYCYLTGRYFHFFLVRTRHHQDLHLHLTSQSASHQPNQEYHSVSLVDNGIPGIISTTS